MFIQTEATPNPATLKFLPGRVVMPEGTFEAKTPEQGVVSPLAERLFAVPGVTGVFFGYDFVTVTKADGESGTLAFYFSIGRGLGDRSFIS